MRLGNLQSGTKEISPFQDILELELGSLAPLWQHIFESRREKSVPQPPHFDIKHYAHIFAHPHSRGSKVAAGPVKAQPGVQSS